MTTFWSVVQTRPRQEPLALRNLERQKYEVFYPFYIKRSKRGQEIVQAVFPSYMFVHLDDESYWTPINSTYGVNRLLTYQNGDIYREPFQIGEGMIDSLRALRLRLEPQRAEGKPQKRDEIPVGARCIVRRGAFVTRTGVVEMSSASRVALLMEVFGGTEVRVNFAREDVEILAPARIDI